MTSLKREWWPIIFIVFFETVLGREHSGKVSKKFIGNFYFWGITLIRCLCFIPVDFIYSCRHRLKKSNFILEKNSLRSIDLLCWWSTTIEYRRSKIKVLHTTQDIKVSIKSTLFENIPAPLLHTLAEAIGSATPWLFTGETGFFMWSWRIGTRNRLCG